MARRKSHRSWKISMPLDQIGKLADRHVEHLVLQGLELQATSGVWRTANGSGTARFVYRSAAGTSMVYTVRGIVLPKPVEAV